MLHNSRPQPTEDRKTNLVGMGTESTTRVRNPMASSSMFAGWGPRLR